ncbi:MAG: patatin-like phospholipase family protein [Deltaproteobacteria bacterium]|nr:patatin-like phospholipase family protein [Deltaproteobacteria bacterium]
MNEQNSYKSVIFAGGGSRCFWQGGFWQAAASALGLAPTAVAGVSAGASTACHIFAGEIEAAMEYYHAAHTYRAKYARPGRNPFLPDPTGLKVYREALESVLEGEPFQRLKQGPDLRIFMSRPPGWAKSALGVGLGYLGYGLDKSLGDPVHHRYARKLGFQPMVGHASECTTVKDLADLVVASSCLPPMVPWCTWSGCKVVDGGILDNAPLELMGLHETPVLVLLTRRYPAEELKGRPGVTYAQPSRDLAISKWEKANPDLVRESYEQGLRDGELFAKHGPEALY